MVLLVLIYGSKWYLVPLRSLSSMLSQTKLHGVKLPASPQNL